MIEPFHLLWCQTEQHTIPSDACHILCICHRYKLPFQPYEGFLGQACAFDVVVFATFPEHHLALAERIAQQECPGQRMVGVMHNSQELHHSGVVLHSNTITLICIPW